MKVRTEVFVHIYANSPFTESSTLIVAGVDMTKFGYVLIGKTQIEIEASPNDVTQAQITQLKEEIKNEEIASAERVSKLEAQINNLLVLETTTC